MVAQTKAEIKRMTDHIEEGNDNEATKIAARGLAKLYKGSPTGSKD